MCPRACPHNKDLKLNTFAELGLSEQALASLTEAGFTEPTEIQFKTIRMVSERKDIIASAQTGSGKTVAYALPILDLLRSSEKNFKGKTRALIIVPTRELAIQVKGEFERFSKNSNLRAVTLYGGAGYGPQIRALHRGADIIVATPGRLLDCVNRGYANLKSVEVVVLDEADRLLDMGFMPQVRNVIEQVPTERQTLMFSATIDMRMQKIAAEFLKNPSVVKANTQKLEPSSIEQKFHYIKEIDKDGILLGLVQDPETGSTITGSVLVFTRTRRKAKSVAARLRQSQVLAEEIHGDISQGQRERTLDRYRKGLFTVLVATDVAARGLDIPTISHVVNYDLPLSPADYVHRIGRTGRAGRSGIAHSFVSNDQRHLIRDIEKLMKTKPADSQQHQQEPEFATFETRQAGRTYADRTQAARAEAVRQGTPARPQGPRPSGAGQRQSYGPKPQSYGQKAQGGYGSRAQSYGGGGGKPQYGQRQEGSAPRPEGYRSEGSRPDGQRTEGSRPSQPAGGHRKTYGPKVHSNYQGGGEQTHGDDDRSARRHFKPKRRAV